MRLRDRGGVQTLCQASGRGGDEVTGWGLRRSEAVRGNR